MIVSTAGPADLPGFLALAAQVEHWFGPMVGDPGFAEAVSRNVERGTALCVRREDSARLRAGMLHSCRPGTCRITWLVVDGADRGCGVGRALVSALVCRVVDADDLEVITFAGGQPAAGPSGARAFYERLGFTAAEAAPEGPDGAPRQWLRRRLR